MTDLEKELKLLREKISVFVPHYLLEEEKELERKIKEARVNKKLINKKEE